MFYFTLLGAKNNKICTFFEKKCKKIWSCQKKEVPLTSLWGKETQKGRLAHLV
jgi:hypothetical protein